MQEERISEKQLIIPALKIIKDLNGATTTELRKYLRQMLRPAGEDLVQLLNRSNGDDKFDQKVRNLTGSHKKLIKLGLAKLFNNRYVLTEKGNELLDTKYEEYEYINSGSFSTDEQAKANEKLLKNNKNEYFIPEEEIHEGKLITTVTKTRQRSAKLRKYAFEHYKNLGEIKCSVCGFDFCKTYGEKLGKDYIELHHQKPISVYEEDGKITNLDEAIKNLVPLCSNCHKILHSNNISVENLKNTIEGINIDER